MRLFSLTVALALAAGGAQADVSVSYQRPEKFSDLPVGARARVLDELTAHFAQLGKQLPPDQHLKIDVTDIDLAGRIDPGRRNFTDVRVLRGKTDWPRIALHYTLEANGKVLGAGDESLSDMAYLDRPNRYADSDHLRYEKKMIDAWFAAKFGARAGS
ncbi:hypothetical protein AAKU55_003846 [Oxalobacteraceae bacterium GrIS 1.11]